MDNIGLDESISDRRTDKGRLVGVYLDKLEKEMMMQTICGSMYMNV